MVGICLMNRWPIENGETGVKPFKIRLKKSIAYRGRWEHQRALADETILKNLSVLIITELAAAKLGNGIVQATLLNTARVPFVR